jgi:hypothetical protein
MRTRSLSIASLVAGLVAGLSLALGASAYAAPLPTGTSTVTGTVGVGTSDGITGQPVTGAQYTFTPVDDSGSYGASNVIIVDVELPAGVTLSGATFDAASTCDTTNGTVTVAGNVADVSGVSCAAGATIVVDLDGSSLITTGGSYDVTAQYKRSIPRRKAPRGGSNPNMWHVTDTGGFTVGA